MFACLIPRNRTLSASVVAAIVVSPLASGWAAEPTPTAALAPADWVIRAEHTDFAETARYPETVDFCRRLAEASPLVQYRVVGRSPEGRDIPILILARDGHFSPSAARAAGRSVFFVNNCIHAGEVAGKDASMMLMRDIVTDQAPGLLDHVVFVVMPIFNVDGHERFSAWSRINQIGPDEMGWRVTAQNINLNRDFAKADSPEMRAWLRVFNEWRPELHFDNHSTDGGDWQFDIATATGSGPGIDPDLSTWIDDRLLPALYAGLEQSGHLPCPYFHMVDRYDPSQGIRSGGLMSPRFATGYVAVRNRASVLVETHVYKPYRTRVLATYWIMRHALAYLNADPAELHSIVEQADRRAAMGTFDEAGTNGYALGSRHLDQSEPFVFKGFAQEEVLSEISGRLWIRYDRGRPIDLTIPHWNNLAPENLIEPPVGYLIPQEFTEVIDRLRAHGLAAFRLTAPLTDRFTVQRLTNVRYPDRSFEGRHRPAYGTEGAVVDITFDSGDIYVPVRQPAGRLVMHLLESTAPDSFLAWGFFNAMLEQKEYAELDVLERIAREMLAENPQLRSEFEGRVAHDGDFARDPYARLYFFYRRSPYWDERADVYPVVRCTSTPKALSPVDWAEGK